MARKRKETLHDHIVRVRGVHRTMQAGLGVSPDDVAEAFNEAMGIIEELLHRRWLAQTSLDFGLDIDPNANVVRDA